MLIKTNKFLLAFLVMLIFLASCSKNSSTTIFNSSTNGNTNALSAKTTKSGEAQLTLSDDKRGNGLLIAQGKFPEASSTDYYNVQENLGSDGKKRLIVTAKILNIAPLSAQDFFTKNNNVSEVVIEAEKVIISTLMNFPGARIIINANELQFTGNGQISTAPNDFSFMPNYGNDGTKGKSAGDLILNITTIDLGGSDHVRFILRGGRGQDAGYGKPGADGKSVNPIYADVVRECVTTSSCDHEAPESRIECKGEGVFPTNGQDALDGGAPGAGGDGGTLYSSLGSSLKTAADVRSGDNGRVAPIVLGGNPGLPIIARIKNMTGHTICPSYGSGGRLSPHSLSSNKSNQDEVRVTTAGKSSKLKPIPLEKSFAGGLKELSADILTPSDRLRDLHGLVKIDLDYAKDLYRNNYFIEALNALSAVVFKLNALEEKNIIDTVNNNEANQLLLQLKTQKDYNGEDLNLAPVLSLEAINQIYKEEIENSFETIAFVTRMKKTVHTAEEKLQAFIDKKSLLENQVTLLQNTYSDAYRKLPDLEIKLANLNAKQELLKDALARLEQSIEKEAEHNMEVKERKTALLGAVKLIATLAKVSPAGQPAATVLGNSISSIVNTAENSKATWFDQMKAGEEIYSNIRKIDWKAARENWNVNYGNLLSDKFKERHANINGSELEAYLKNLYDATKPMAEAVVAYNKDYINTEVPRSEYEAEVRRIQEDSPLFKDAIEKLNQVQKAKEEMNSLLLKTTAAITNSQSQIIKDFIMISSLESDESTLTKGLDFSVDQVLSSIEKEARFRLLKYKAAFIKAYSYRTLMPFTGNLDLEKLDNKLNIFLTKTEEKEIDVNALKRIYEDDLRAIANSLFDLIQNGNYKEFESSFNKELNTGEIAALNAGKTIYLDLAQESEFRENEENIRIISISMNDFSSELNDGDPGTLDLEVALNGASTLIKNKTEYSFVYSNQMNNYKWTTRLDPATGNALLNKEISENIGLLELVMGKEASNNSLLFNRVGGRSTFLVKLNGNLQKVHLSYGKLNIRYSYSNK